MLGDRIRELRKEKGVTLKELGKILNLGESTISMYENNNRNPDYDTLKLLADYFNVTTDYLLGLDDKIETIAAHHEGEDYTKEELEQIEAFKAFVRSKRENKDNRGD